MTIPNLPPDPNGNPEPPDPREPTPDVPPEGPIPDEPPSTEIPPEYPGIDEPAWRAPGTPADSDAPMRMPGDNPDVETEL